MNQATIQINGGTAELQLKEKTFKSGKDGFFGQGKIIAGNKRYQAQIIATEIVKD